jgi:hypothetical protein
MHENVKVPQLLQKFPYHNSRDQLHIMTNYPTKYESYKTNNLRGVAFANITILKLHENLNSPIILQKSLNQNGGIIGSTNHDDQSSYQI